jgi:glycosyltransferase involved in cell wall biosynthesis
MPTPHDAVSVVVPVFKSTDTLVELVARVYAALPDRRFEIILVDDGSPPETWETIGRIAAGAPMVRGIRLSRNAGQHSALLAGVRAARYPNIVTIDDDLQNPPEEIPCLLAALDEGADVVYGVPRNVAQRHWRRSSSLVSRTLMSSALGAENAARMSSFRAFRTRLRDGFDGELGPSVALDALLSWSTSTFASVEVDHHSRKEGKSNYNFRKLLRFAMDTATGYSTVPLQVATALGMLTALFGIGVLVWVIGRLIISGTSVPGFPFLASIIAVFAGVQLVTLGVIGEYLARMHFRVMRKPSYVVAEVLDPTPADEQEV